MYIQNGYILYKNTVNKTIDGVKWSRAVGEGYTKNGKTAQALNKENVNNATTDFIWDDIRLKYNVDRIVVDDNNKFSQKFPNILNGPNKIKEKLKTLVKWENASKLNVANYDAGKRMTFQLKFLTYTKNDQQQLTYKVVNLTYQLIYYSDAYLSLYNVKEISSTKNEAGVTWNEVLKNYQISSSSTAESDIGRELDGALQDEAQQAANQANADIQALEDLIASSVSFGETVSGSDRATYQNFDDVLTDTDFYTNISDITSTDADKVEKATGKVLSVITNIGMVLSALMLAILGVKYMIGSVEEKAEYKKDLMPYLVGATLLFSICIVVKILQMFGNQINNI